ncbi:sialic acid-binding Ig-like lectin 14 [Leptodactylus fuscus]|uniref:sialic acid-binding Ig-like lectin 14 n=1 Tax=Leptodactylus fuscus TaxID=238119 RepID=UPI003F4EE626
MRCKFFCYFMEYYMAFILIQSQLWSSNICERLPGYSIKTRYHVTVQRGLCVHVLCLYTMPSDVRRSINTTAIWYKAINGSGIWIAEKSGYGQRTNGLFYFTGDVSRGDCSYYIEDPVSSDSGRYYLMVKHGSTKYSYTDMQPYVSVTALTDKPTISSTRLVDGKTGRLTCTSPGKCWNFRPNVSWHGKIPGMRENTYNMTDKDGRTFHSSIRFTPKKSDHRSSLHCRVAFQKDLSTVKTLTLNVEYPPSMDINITGVNTRHINHTNDTTTVTVKDGDSITLKCIIDSNPDASITWYKEDKMVQRTKSGQTLTLMNITHSDARRFRCSAENEHGDTHRMVVIKSYNGESFGNHYIEIILLATLGPICPLLLVLLVYACCRKRQKKLPSTEAESIYTELRISEITSIYAQLKIPADITDVGSDQDESDASVHNNNVRSPLISINCPPHSRTTLWTVTLSFDLGERLRLLHVHRLAVSGLWAGTSSRWFLLMVVLGWVHTAFFWNAPNFLLLFLMEISDQQKDVSCPSSTHLNIEVSNEDTLRGDMLLTIQLKRLISTCQPGGNEG